MKQIFYHVVTEKPLELGQELIFDDTHHNNVYNRVHKLKDKVNDIYQNPNQYKNINLDHHLKVALRELALEEVRKKNYPKDPSRLASLYVSQTLEEAEKWYKIFIDLKRPTYAIVKVEVDGQIYIGDSWNCFEGTINQENNLKLAKRYWSSKKNQLGKEPIIEVLVNGKIKVIEIVKEVNQKKLI